MPETEQLLLALASGALFGVLVYLVVSSWRRLALLLFLIWTMTSLPQYLYRQFDGQDVFNEVVKVTLNRLVFGLAALVVLELLNRYWRKGAQS
jgi:hypothetical protein